MVTPPPSKPHGGGQAEKPARRVTVKINGKPAIRTGDSFACKGKTPAEPAAVVVVGSGNVMLG
jgi:uncharacterized Zn-binding protein involved in type VI secretion